MVGLVRAAVGRGGMAARNAGSPPPDAPALLPPPAPPPEVAAVPARAVPVRVVVAVLMPPRARPR